MKIDFGKACGELFSTEKKWMTVLGMAVCFLIPAIGPIVLIGYMFRRFARERRGKPVEDFDFNHFVDYLMIGLWPFLSTLVLSLFLMPIIVVAMVPFFAATAFEADNQPLMWMLIGVGMLLYLLAIIAYMLFSFPVMLRSGLMMGFKVGFCWSFITSFIRKVGWSLILYYFLLVLLAFPLSLLGSLALLVGVYVVMAWVQLTMMSLVFQHYDLYLERGGESIEFAEELVKEYGAPPVPRRQGGSGSAPPGLPAS
ncbi:MAG: DUF4013 domain-containing protein [Verrucomicrobiota bacterium]